MKITSRGRTSALNSTPASLSTKTTRRDKDKETTKKHIKPERVGVKSKTKSQFTAHRNLSTAKTVSKTLPDLHLVVSGLEKHRKDDKYRVVYLDALELICKTNLFKRFWISYNRKDVKASLESLLAGFITQQVETETSLILLSYVNPHRHLEASKVALSTSDPNVISAALRLGLPNAVRERLLTDNYENEQVRQSIFTTWK
ncbi:hypothetical protein TrRE_jg518, partial [Triparma retinervis]